MYCAWIQIDFWSILASVAIEIHKDTIIMHSNQKIYVGQTFKGFEAQIVQ